MIPVRHANVARSGVERYPRLGGSVSAVESCLPSGTAGLYRVGFRGGTVAAGWVLPGSPAAGWGVGLALVDQVRGRRVASLFCGLVSTEDSEDRLVAGHVEMPPRRGGREWWEDRLTGHVRALVRTASKPETWEGPLAYMRSETVSVRRLRGLFRKAAGRGWVTWSRAGVLCGSFSKTSPDEDRTVLKVSLRFGRVAARSASPFNHLRASREFLWELAGDKSSSVEMSEVAPYHKAPTVDS